MLRHGPPHDRPPEDVDLGRRAFLQQTGGVVVRVAAAGYVAGMGIRGFDRAIGHAEDKEWPHDEPSFRFLGGEKHTDQKQLTIYMPGFGDMHSEEEAKAWKEASGLDDMLTGYVSYSNQGVDTDKIVELILAQIDPSKLESVNFVCRSIGGLYMSEVAAKLKIPVRSITLISSPSRLSYGDFGNAGEVAAKMPRSRALATIAKLAVNTYVSYSHHGFNPYRNLQEGWGATLGGANPLALQEELKTAAGIHLSDPKLNQKLRKVFTKSTKVVYAATEHPDTDTTVHVTESFKEFERFFKRFGIQCRQAKVPYDGHANVVASASFLKKWTQAAMSLSRTLLTPREN